jgi:hypothetical protein
MLNDRIRPFATIVLFLREALNWRRLRAMHYEDGYVHHRDRRFGDDVADVLLDETDANILMIDHHGATGGYWNDANPFVRSLELKYN